MATIWEVRHTGALDQAGGFDSSLGGVDYSQQDGYQWSGNCIASYADARTVSYGNIALRIAPSMALLPVGCQGNWLYISLFLGAGGTGTSQSFRYKGKILSVSSDRKMMTVRMETTNNCVPGSVDSFGMPTGTDTPTTINWAAHAEPSSNYYYTLKIGGAAYDPFTAASQLTYNSDIETAADIGETGASLTYIKSGSYLFNIIAPKTGDYTSASFNRTMANSLTNADNADLPVQLLGYKTTRGDTPKGYDRPYISCPFGLRLQVTGTPFRMKNIRIGGDCVPVNGYFVSHRSFLVTAYKWPGSSNTFEIQNCDISFNYAQGVVYNLMYLWVNDHTYNTLGVYGYIRSGCTFSFNGTSFNEWGSPYNQAFAGWRWRIYDPVTLSAELATGAAFLEGYGSTQDIYASGTGGFDTGKVRIDGSGTFFTDDVSATGSLVSEAAAISGSGVYYQMDVSGAGGIDTGAVQLDGAGVSTRPVFAGTGGIDVAAIFISGSGTYRAGMFNGVADLDLGAITVSGSGTYVPQSVSSVVATAFSNAPNLITYRDAIEHLVDFFDGLTQESDQKRARGAIQAAYRDVAFMRKWRYLQTHYRIQLSAPQTTGTVTYDSSTRRLTLSGSTWPTWARNGHVRITGYDPVYKVAERTSSTILTLDSVFCPQSTISTAKTYTLFRSTYDLPGDLWAMEDIHDEQGCWSAGYLQNEEWMTYERRFKNTGRPFSWTVIGSPDVYGQLTLCVYGYPSSSESLDFIYTRRPRLLRLDGYELFSSETSPRAAKGVSATGYEVTFDDDFVYEASMVGAILRLGRPGQTTTPKGFGQRDQWWQQKVIVDAGTSGNQLLVDSPVTGGFGPKFTISDPVDLPEYLFEAFLTGCEYHMLKKTDAIKAGRHYQLFINDIKMGAARDSVTPFPKVAWGQSMRNTAAWRLLTGSITPSGG